jgi:hypothetical protein
MLSLIAALIALPIVLLVGGPLELTVAGAIKVAAWVTLAALIQLLVLSPFILWRESRPSTVLSCTVDDAVDGCVVRNVTFDEPLPRGLRTPESATFLRIRVETAGSIKQVDDCRARLLRIERNGAAIFRLPDYRLPFVTHGDGASFAGRVRKGEPEFVDVLTLTDENEVWLTTTDYRHSLVKLLTPPGDYVFHIVISTPLGSIPVAAALAWHGDRVADAATWCMAR